MNRAKIIARASAFILMLLILTALTACTGGYGSRVDRSISFETNTDFVEFIENYNSRNDGFVYTFIMFDLDNNIEIETYKYELNTMWKAGYDLSKMYDKNHSKGFRCNAIFHMYEINAQIKCEYSTPNYNFYQDDNMSFEFIESYEAFSPDGVCEEWADLRTFNSEASDYDKYYEYMYIYQISVNGKEKVTVRITSEKEISKEKLNEIVTLLVENIVIINTEG